MVQLKRVKSGKRLDQIEKILKYAKEFLNVDIVFVDHKKMGNDSGGYIAPKGQSPGLVTISNNYNGITTIFILIHELGHHIDFLKRGYVLDEDIAYQYYPVERGGRCPIKYRRLIRNVEDQAIKYAYELAIYLDLKLPAFQYLKDEFFTRDSLELVLKNGPMTSEEINKLKKKCTKKAKLLLKTEYPNQKTLPLVKR